jgi:biopolymer transport protein ExbD
MHFRAGYGGDLLLSASRDEMNLGGIMLRKRRKPEKLFSDFNTLQFASVMAMVIFVPLVLFMMWTTPHHGISTDLAKVMHPVSMPSALREDAMRVTVTRDGRVWFGTDPVYRDDLTAKIQQRLKEPGIERKVYIIVDFRAHWGNVKLVLDGIRSAGILRVAFLTDQRKS